MTGKEFLQLLPSMGDIFLNQLNHPYNKDKEEEFMRWFKAGADFVIYFVTKQVEQAECQHELPEMVGDRTQCVKCNAVFIAK